MAHTHGRSKAHRRRLPPHTNYFLRARWKADDQVYSNAQAVDTRSEGVETGSLTITDIDGQLEISSEVLTLTAPSSDGWGEIGFLSQGFPKVLGRAFMHHFNFSDATKYGVFGMNDANAFGSANGAFSIYWGNAMIIIRTDDGSTETPNPYTFSSSTDYWIAYVFGGVDASERPWSPRHAAGEPGAADSDYSYGMSLFIKGGAWNDWTLLWKSFRNNAGTLYATLESHSHAGTSREWVVSDKDFRELLKPVALSTFYAVNGTSLDAYTPEEGNHWVERTGDWDIQAQQANPDGAAIATVTTVLSDVVIRAIVNGGAADQPAIVLRYSDTSNYWYVQADRANNQFEIHEYNATVDTVRASNAHTINNDTDYDIFVSANGQTILGYIDAAYADGITYGSAALNETAKVHGIRAENAAGLFNNFVIYRHNGGHYRRLDDLL